MTAGGLLLLSAAELGRQIAGRKLSSREATTAVLEALAERAPALNALARLRPEQALAQADAADREIGVGHDRGALHGVPLAHKDMFPRAGEVAELGSTLLTGNVATATATVIERLDTAGAVDVGRLNMVEFALGITGHNAHTGTPRNAWDETRVTGGSTSGGATTVAARLVPATLGSDTGGSIRVPAALCGLVGIKSTYGRVSRAGCMPLSFTLDHIGPLARTAEDCALILDAIAGRDPADPATSTRPAGGYARGIDGGVRGLRVGTVTAGLDVEVAADVAAACTAAVDLLADLGATVRPVTLPDMAANAALRRVVMLAEAAGFHREQIAHDRDAYNPQTANRMAPGFAVAAADYLRAVAARAMFLERFVATVLTDTDVVALPACPVTAPPIDATDTGGDARFLTLANSIGGLVGPFNYLGLPALSVPVGLGDDGLPVGLQLVARPFAEALLLRTAHALQREIGILTPP